MAWLEIHTVLPRHRKNLGLARDLRLKSEWTMGNLIALWLTVLEQQEDGDLSKWSDDLIAESGGFQAKGPQIVELLYKHGLLDRDTRLVHDWLEYAGKLLKSKYASGKAKKVAQNRDRLEAIWEKHGKFLDAAHRAKCESRKPPTPVPRDTQGEPEGVPRHTTKQNTTQPPKEKKVAGEKETFNRGLHHDIAAVAASLVSLYFEVVKTAYRDQKVTATTAIGQLLLDEPGTTSEAIEKGIKAYARYCDQRGAPAEKRKGPRTFIEDRVWECFDEEDAPKPASNARLDKYK